MITVTIDSREPKQLISSLKRRFKDRVTFEVKKLEEGDYESSHVLFERKKVGDLYSSIMSNRLEQQCCRLAQHDDKVIGLMIYGSIEGYKKEMRIKKKIIINEKHIISAVAEMTCRYNLLIIWTEDEKTAYSLMISLMEDVEENKYQIPLRCTEEILISRLLKITPKQYKELCKVCATTSLSVIGKASVTTLMRVKGIGDKKAEHIKKVLK